MGTGQWRYWCFKENRRKKPSFTHVYTYIYFHYCHFDCINRAWRLLVKRIICLYICAEQRDLSSRCQLLCYYACMLRIIILDFVIVLRVYSYPFVFPCPLYLSTLGNALSLSRNYLQTLAHDSLDSLLGALGCRAFYPCCYTQTLGFVLGC